MHSKIHIFSSFVYEVSNLNELKLYRMIHILTNNENTKIKTKIKNDNDTVPSLYKEWLVLLRLETLYAQIHHEETTKLRVLRMAL